MTKEEIARINELAKKSREEGLSDQEKDEQRALRQQYLKEFRGNFEAVLQGTEGSRLRHLRRGRLHPHRRGPHPR